ncbi:MAG TPA: glycosyltransferase, partial [Kofleriaceae bacterium]|nr:glycosyltransferase [Kofleriaceae bacterium]
TQVPPQIAALRDVVRAARPDVIAIDPLAYAGVVVAEQEQIPWASISTQLLALTPPGFSCPYLEYLGDLATDRDRLLAVAGVAARFELGEAVSPWLSTVFATEAFAPADRRGRHAICVGPPSPLGPRGDERPFPWERLRGGVPLVYASFGSQLAPAAAVYEALERALPPDEADLVIAYNGQEPPPTPPHVVAVAWAPQLALLERAAAMVTHGGANSVTECLTHGKPMLVVPLPADQPLQACLVERSGAGLVLTPEAAAVPETLAAALRALLADGPLRRRAAELGQSYAAADGARRTAELLALLGQTRTPIPIDA